jgi:hypothetical protein
MNRSAWRRSRYLPAGHQRPSLGPELAYVFFMTAASALIGVFAIVWSGYWESAHSEEQDRSSPLVLEGKIPLGSVAGRIDHMAVDVARHRLFVAELGNNTVGVIDLQNKKVVHRLSGLREPQGIAYVPPTDTIFVANGGDGTVRVFRGSDYSQVARIDLGDDADNVRFDAKRSKVLVGFGGGGIAIIDPAKNEKIGETSLPAHPESFRLDSSSGRVFVNLPNASAVGVLGRDLKLQQNWKTPYGGNFAMTLDSDNDRVLVAFRRPARLVAYDSSNGRPVADTETCADVDDLFYASKSRRVYVICGSGAIDVRDAASAKYSRLTQIQTVAGARTGLFVPEFNTLFVGVRGHGREVPAIWAYTVK